MPDFRYFANVKSRKRHFVIKCGHKKKNEGIKEKKSQERKRQTIKEARKKEQ